MVEKGTFLVADLYDSYYIEEVGPSRGYTSEVMDKAELTADAQRKGFRKAAEAGIRLAFGTDSGVIPHGTNARQFASYVDNGLTPVEAIQTATSWAADLMGWDDRVGAISPGRHADLVVLDTDPLDDITSLERPVGVMKGGTWVVDPVSAL
jgi:imidazolonepropionase-like amidohydrolase